MRPSEDVPVASDDALVEGDDAPVAGDEPGAAGTAQSRPPGRWRLWWPWLSLLAKPARRIVLIFALVLVIEYLVVPELVGASKDLYLLGRVSAWWVAAGVVLEGVSLFCYAVLTKVLLPPGPKPILSVLFRIDLSAAADRSILNSTDRLGLGPGGSSTLVSTA